MTAWRWLSVGVVATAVACGPAPRPPDAGGGDAGLLDAAVVDAGDVDAGAPDGGPLDGGVDGGGRDAGGQDAGPLDAGDRGAPSTTYPAYPIAWPQLRGSDAGVLARPRFVVVTFDGDPHRAALEAFVSGIGATEYWRVTTAEYGVAPATTAPPVHLASPPPTLLDDTDIQTFLTLQLDGTHPAWPQPDGQTAYVLFYPATTTITLFGKRQCTNFGGYHSSLRLGGVLTPYAVMPRCPASLSPPAVATELGLLTGVTSHELNEVVTSAEPSAQNGYVVPGDEHLPFVLFSGAETGDMCQFNPAAWVVDPELGRTVQRAWSNREAAAGREPCVPAAAGPYFAAVPSVNEDVPVLFGGVTIRSKGINLRPNQSATVQLLLVSSADTGGPFTVDAQDRLSFFGQGRSLAFSFDRTSGVNGEKLNMTVTRVGNDPAYGGAMPFLIRATKGTTSTYWFSVVGALP